ncbi:MAG: TetR/AcrR family transcriptional regulator [Rhodobacteraceae bacterium]|nr:TetR/AcrR family transcriptional regulator [Paracoccaceae bacterium]
MLNQPLEAPKSKSEQILAAAEALVRQSGYNGISYRHVADEVGISKATLHHYFPTKADLGLAVIERFRSEILKIMCDLHEKEHNPLTKLSKYLGVYTLSLSENKLCLCGMLAAEHATLSEQMQTAVTDFFGNHIDWLEIVLREGLMSGRLQFEGNPRRHAKMILATMQGGLLVAKAQGSTENLESLTEHLLSMYRAPHR